MIAFTDGSYDEKQRKCSCGVLIIDKDGNNHELCMTNNNPKYLPYRNVTGEIFGVINAMDWAISNGYQKIKIYHDYEGLSKWISGEWKAKTPVSEMYVKLYVEKFDGVLDVVFEKVVAHSGNEYNEKADKLARLALEEGKYITVKGESWFTVSNFNKTNFERLIALIQQADSNVQVSRKTFSNKEICVFNLGKYKVTVTGFYSSSCKLLVQGRVSLLLQILISAVNEITDVKLEYICGNVYRKTVDQKIIVSDFEKLCPIFPVDYPDNIKKLVMQAVINLRYYAESEDYSQYAFPAIKALEGHIKYLIQKAGGTVGKLFNQFNRSPNSVNYFFTAPLRDNSLKVQIEKCFNYYKSERDTIMHFGDIIGSTDSTRIIESKKDADYIIKNCIKLICEA